MKNLLIYQTSEYDCGTTCLLNALRFLFEREELNPDIVKALMTYSLDSCDANGEPGKQGTTSDSMRYIGCWVNRYSRTRQFPLHCTYLQGEDVQFFPGSQLYHALQQGSVVVLHLYLGCPHYVLATEITDHSVLIFDPFYEELDDPELDEEYSEEGITMHTDAPKKYNREITLQRLHHFTHNYYEMGEYEARHALIFCRTTT